MWLAAVFTKKNNAKKLNWRSLGALLFFSCAIAGFQLGVYVSERPDVVDSGILTQIYYSLSLFVLGGVDLGMPVGGTQLGRFLMWLAYFGAPILAASTIIDALLRALAPQGWKFRRIKNHIVVVGANELTLSYLRVLRKHDIHTPVIVVSKQLEKSTAEELEQSFAASVIIGDITHDFFIKQLQLEHVKKILLLGNDSLRSYEAASNILNLFPNIGKKVVIHCGNLRFMRAMSTSRVAKECQTFNTYHLAALGLVHNHLLQHFQQTKPKDVVILAGFGRFGQTILEELQDKASEELDTVVIVDKDAHRRVMVADEQMEFTGNYHRALFEGDISHPDVWRKLQIEANLGVKDTVVVLGTGREEDNLRTALWIKYKFPRTKVIARSSKESRFATEVAKEHDIVSISITQLVEENIPKDWLG